MCTNFERDASGKLIIKKMKEEKYPVSYDDEFTDEDYDNLKCNDIRITTDILTLKLIDKEPKLTIMNWSINWNPKMLIYNSRIETIRETPRWKTIFKNGRVLIPATMFYEYRPPENDPPEAKAFKKENKIKKKSKFGITIPGQDFFFIGGIYIWNKDMNYCSMITTPPHKDLSKIPHHRCPYLLEYSEAMEFLEADPDYLLDKVDTYPKNRKLEIKQVR